MSDGCSEGWPHKLLVVQFCPMREPPPILHLGIGCGTGSDRVESNLILTEPYGPTMHVSNHFLQSCVRVARSPDRDGHEEDREREQ